MLVWKNKKVVFYNDKLIIKNKYKITYKNIERCWYTYRTIKSILKFKLLSLDFGGGIGNVMPGWLIIHLSNRLKFSDKGFCKYKRDKKYWIRLKPEAINKLPKSLFNRIIFNELFTNQ